MKRNAFCWIIDNSAVCVLLFSFAKNALVSATTTELSPRSPIRLGKAMQAQDIKKLHIFLSNDEENMWSLVKAQDMDEAREQSILEVVVDEIH